MTNTSDSTAADPIFTDQTNQPATTHRPNYKPPNPYADQFYDANIEANANDSSSSNVRPPTKLIYDNDILKKYNRAAPRYTSYPTALELKPIKVGTEMDVLTSRDPNTPLSLTFHIPFCSYLCYYCNRNKIITKKNSDASDYLTYLKQEVIRKRALLMPPNHTESSSNNPYVKQVHLGGGTPTFFKDNEIVELWQFLQSQFDFAPSDNKGDGVITGDYSIEIDPRELGDDTLKTLRKLGFNRLSFGVQDLDNEVQNAVNRVQSEELITSVMTEARELGFGSINIDLIYGLPKQTTQSFAETVARIITLAPDRLSIFDYVHLPLRFKAQCQINDADLPSSDAKLAMFTNTVSVLTEAGYHYIGIDHFAKPDDALAIAKRNGELHRNFQGYTTIGDCDLLGFGVSAISQINSTVYANRGNSASHILQNSTDLTTYKADIDAGKLPAIKHIKRGIKDRLRGYVIAHLLCHDRVDFKDINQKFGIDAMTYFINDIQKLEPMQQDKLIDIDAAGIQIMPKGRLFARHVAMAFDAYLPDIDFT